jgi:hypothetical protein
MRKKDLLLHQSIIFIFIVLIVKYVNFILRRFSQLYNSNKSQSQSYNKSSEWTRPIAPNESSTSSLAPPLPPTFLPPPNPLRLVTSKPEPGRPGSLAPSPHTGPTPTFRSDINLRCYKFSTGLSSIFTVKSSTVAFF